jgi:polar amino acid transport system substrate-binding protein
MKKSLFVLVSIVTLFAMVLAGCAPQTIEKTVVVEKVVQQTVQVEKTVQVKETVVVEAKPTAVPECKPVAEVKGNLIKSELIMSTNATIPPVQYIDETGALKGMRIELGEEIAKRLCLKPVWVNIQFDAMIPGLQGKRWDMINTGLFFTDARAKIMYLIPYELQAISISVLKDNPKKVSKTEDLADLKVGVEIGGYEETNIKAINDAQVKAGLKPMTIQTFNTFAEAYQALKAGQLDAVTSVDATAKFYQDKGDFVRAISGLRGSPASLAFNDPDLANSVNAALQSMKDDGSYDKLFDKYGVAKVTAWDKWDGKFKVWHTK